MDQFKILIVIHKIRTNTVKTAINIKYKYRKL